MKTNKQETEKRLITRKKETEAAVIAARCRATNELRSNGATKSKGCVRDCNSTMLIVHSGRVTQLFKHLKKIDQALKRLHNDTYGICRVCEQPISEKRLLVCPETDICVDCKTASELVAQTPAQTRKFFPHHETRAIAR